MCVVLVSVFAVECSLGLVLVGCRRSSVPVGSVLIVSVHMGCVVGLSVVPSLVHTVVLECCIECGAVAMVETGVASVCIVLVACVLGAVVVSVSSSSG